MRLLQLLNAWRRVVCLLLVGTLTLVGALSAAALADEQSQSQSDLQQWVVHLSSSSYHQRNLAASRLHQAGLSAVDVLVAGLDGADLDATVKIIDVLQKLSAELDLSTTDSDPAWDALLEIGINGTSSASTRAKVALENVRSVRKQSGLKALIDAGVFIGTGKFYLGSSTVDDWHIRIDERWNGKTQTLRWLSWVPDYKTIVLVGQQIDGQTIKYAAQLPDLRVMIVSDTRVAVEDLQSLTRLRSLDQFQLQNSESGDELIDVLKRLPIRVKLNIFGTDVTKSGYESLVKAFPDLQVQCRGGFLGVECSSYYVECQVNKVTDGSAAQEAGVKPNDVIVQLGEFKVRNFPDLQEAISNHMTTKKELPLVVLREDVGVPDTQQSSSDDFEFQDLDEIGDVTPAELRRRIKAMEQFRRNARLPQGDVPVPAIQGEPRSQSMRKEIQLKVTLKRNFPV